jgi:hypothetical protein
MSAIPFPFKTFAMGDTVIASGQLVLSPNHKPCAHSKSTQWFCSHIEPSLFYVPASFFLGLPARHLSPLVACLMDANQ